MQKLALCISCLNGEWTAAGFRRGAPSGFWQSPTTLEDFSASRAFFLESHSQVKAEGRTVGLVLAHPRLINQLVDVPPVKGTKLSRYLERRVQQLKTFEGEAAWSYQRAMPIKGTESALVHLFPKAMLAELAAGCTEAGGQLVRVIPSTAVLASQLRELPIEKEKEELVLIAADTGQSTTVIIGRRDGRVCLGRVLRGTWATQPERLAVDLSRTIGFAEQQSGLTVNSVWLFGANADAGIPEIQKALHAPVRVSPVPYAPSYWAIQAGKLPLADDGNLVTLDDRQAPQRRRLVTLTTASLILMLSAALGAAAYTKHLIQVDREAIQKFDGEIERWRTAKKDWQARHLEMARKKDLVRLVVDGQAPPVPAWFLGYLGAAVSPDLLLTGLAVDRMTNGWKIELAGTAQPSTNDTPIVLRGIVNELTNRLVAGPFHVNITRNSLEAERTPGPGRPPLPGSVPLPLPTEFHLDGVVR